MPAPIRLLGLRAQPLDPQECEAAVADPTAGGLTLFTGSVRSVDEGRPVTALEYEAHPGAQQALHAVAERAAALPGVVAVAALHRTGLLAVGDVAVVVAASAAHRDEAFAACRQLIDELKATVPIWKRQVFAGGGQEWVGLP